MFQEEEGIPLGLSLLESPYLGVPLTSLQAELSLSARESGKAIPTPTPVPLAHPSPTPACIIEKGKGKGD